MKNTDPISNWSKTLWFVILNRAFEILNTVFEILKVGFVKWLTGAAKPKNKKPDVETSGVLG